MPHHRSSSPLAANGLALSGCMLAGMWLAGCSSSPSGSGGSGGSRMTEGGGGSMATGGTRMATGGGAAVPTGGQTAATGGATGGNGSGTGGFRGTGGDSSDAGMPAASGGRGDGGRGTGGGIGGEQATGGMRGPGGFTGIGGATATGGGGAVGSDPFVLAWQDDFNALNTSTWLLQSFTFDGNQATFTPQNATVANGVLTMSLTNAPSGAAKPYLGVEARSSRTLTYGKISARMRFAKGSGVVSGLVLFYTPFPNCDWNEIDIEHLGKVATSSQLNAMVYTGPYNAGCTVSVSPTQEPLLVPLGFDAEADYHLYDVEWTPAGVKYFADGVLLRTWTSNIGLLKRPMNILLTIWASNAADWAGAIGPSSAPSTTDIDWIKVYDWRGQ